MYLPKKVFFCVKTCDLVMDISQKLFMPITSFFVQKLETRKNFYNTYISNSNRIIRCKNRTQSAATPDLMTQSLKDFIRGVKEL